MKKFYTAEAVSLGHPDKMADFITSCILDAFIKKDSKTKYAVEVLVKNNTVVLGGEVTSKVSFLNDELLLLIKDALKLIGYDEKYSKIWKENAIDINSINLINLISHQSDEINMGVDDDGEYKGWGDQGIYLGYATKENPEALGDEHYLAKKLNYTLYSTIKDSSSFLYGCCGLDIKTEIALSNSNIDTVIIAVPTLNSNIFKEKKFLDLVRVALDDRITDNTKIIINGTGAYKTHSSIADCGITGRKLACDFYSSRCAVGGGSPWTKDGTKADVTLNLYSRYLAKKYIGTSDECFVYLSSCIGKDDLVSSSIKRINCDKITIEELKKDDIKSVKELIALFSLDKDVYASLCLNSVKGAII